MQGNDGLANQSEGYGHQQVLGPSSGNSAMTTRSQARGRADPAESRTPISGRALGEIWTSASVAAASSTSPPSGGPTAGMVALQQQMELLLIQNQEQARRHDQLLALLSSQQQMVASLQGQVQALTVDGSSRLPPPPGDAPVREPPSSPFVPVEESIPVGHPVDGAASAAPVHPSRAQFDDDDHDDGAALDGSDYEDVKFSAQSPRRSSSARASADRSAQQLEFARIQSLDRSSESIVKGLPKFEELGYPRWREKVLSIRTVVTVLTLRIIPYLCLCWTFSIGLAGSTRFCSGVLWLNCPASMVRIIHAIAVLSGLMLRWVNL